MELGAWRSLFDGRLLKRSDGGGGGRTRELPVPIEAENGAAGGG